MILYIGLEVILHQLQGHAYIRLACELAVEIDA